MLVLLLWLGLALAQETEVDPVALATTLARDGHLDRAAIALADVDPTTLEPAGQRQVYRLLGLIAWEQGDAARAVEQYRAALAAPPSVGEARSGPRGEAARSLAEEEARQAAVTRLHLAQALLALPEPAADEAIAALVASGLRDRAGWWLLSARAQELRGEPGAAFGLLTEGAAVFPEDTAFLKAQVFVLIELQLYAEAVARGVVWMEREGARPEAFLAIAEGLRRGASGDPASLQLRRAQEILELGRLHFPESPELRRLHARVLLERGQPLSAAMLLHEASYSEPDRALEAAEAYRRAGRLDRALLMNGQVVDSTEKTRQRMGILLEMGAFERVLALEARLSRLGLLREDRIAYGLAYAQARTGEHEAAERSLARIQDPAVFEAASALRLWLARCETDGGCL